MKHILIILAFVVSTFSVKAQEDKPTKEQTLEFLNHYYKINTWRCTDGDVDRSFEVTDISFLDSCKIRVKWIFYFTHKSNEFGLIQENFYNEIDIDMRNVEKLSYSGSRFEDCILYYLKFTAKPGAKFISKSKTVTYLNKNIRDNGSQDTDSSIEVSIPICQVYLVNNDINISEETEKVRKAFNHLRKLCGAPDPIKFD